jgi:hypothetical protein
MSSENLIATGGLNFLCLCACPRVPDPENVWFRGTTLSWSQDVPCHRATNRRVDIESYRAKLLYLPPPYLRLKHTPPISHGQEAVDGRVPRPRPYRACRPPSSISATDKEATPHPTRRFSIVHLEVLERIWTSQLWSRKRKAAAVLPPPNITRLIVRNDCREATPVSVLPIADRKAWAKRGVLQRDSEIKCAASAN